VANSYVTLGANTARTIWMQAFVEIEEQESVMSRLFAKPGEGGLNAPGMTSDEKTTETFVVDAVSNVVGPAVPWGATLTSNTTAQQWKATTGTRHTFAQAVAMRKKDMAKTPRDLKAHVMTGLAHHWARLKDQYLVYEMSLGKSSAIFEAAEILTDADAYQAGLTNLGTGVTSDFNAVVNTKNIGRDDVDTTTYKGLNCWACGELPETSGPITSIPADFWDTAMDADPTQYQPRVVDFVYLQQYLADRSVPSLRSVDKKTNVRQGIYIVFLPLAAITALRRDPEYIDVRDNNQEFAYELYDGTMYKTAIEGLVLIQANHDMATMVGNTPLRAEAVTVNGTVTHLKVEGLVVGGASVAQSSYDDSLDITEAAENDFNRTPKYGYDMIYGATKTYRVDDSAQLYANCASLLMTVPIWGAPATATIAQ